MTHGLVPYTPDFHSVSNKQLDLFKTFSTFVYDIDFKITKIYRKVDMKQAKKLLNVVDHCRSNLNINQLDVLYFADKPNIKFYALRSRLMLPENELLRKYHDIRCKGPVVVTLMRDDKEEICEKHELLPHTESLPFSELESVFSITI